MSFRVVGVLAFLLMSSTIFGSTHGGRDVEYGRAGDLSLKMDYAIPEGKGPFPAVILVHGGGWVSGDRRANLQPLFAPLEKAGIAWFSISYRLATGVLDFGLAIDDVETAVRFVKAHAADYGVDPARLALLGESAGGHLASMAALRGHLGRDVRAVVALYSPSDLVLLARTSPSIPQAIRQAVENSPMAPLILSALKNLSPVENVSPSSPPFLLIHGTRDNLVPFSQSSEFCGRLRQAGGPCELLPVEGAGHGLRWWGVERESYQAYLIRWLQQQFAHTS